MNVLAITAHPDDAEFQCAGTLILLKKLGHKIAIATVNNGSCGSADKGPKEIIAIRGKEARQAAKLIGADYFCAGINDLESVFDNETRRKVCEIVRAFGAEIIFATHPGDYMSDHEIASRLARDATFTATLPNYSTGASPASPKLNGIPHLYYLLPTEGCDHFGAEIIPDFVVNIGDVIAKKTEMLACHASQREWLRKEHGMDEYVEFMKRDAARVGAMSGFEYGEGFIQHRGHAYPRENILARILHGLRSPVKYPLWPQHDAAKVSTRRKSALSLDFARDPEPVEGLKIHPSPRRKANPEQVTSSGTRRSPPALSEPVVSMVEPVKGKAGLLPSKPAGRKRTK